MILEIKPRMLDIPETRKALAVVMKQLGIRNYCVFSRCNITVSLDFLSIKISEADALIFELANGGMMITDQYGRDGCNKANRGYF